MTVFRLRSEALVETSRASRYLVQLCRHFTHDAHSRSGWIVEFDDEHGVAEFGWIGSCTMQAQERGLLLRIRAADPLRRVILQRVMDSHVQRFGRRDGLTVCWRPARR